MTSFKRTQRKDVQKAYRVRNWREYETGLRARGSLTVWLGLTDGKLANWNSPRPTRRKPGRQRKYSNHAIETTVTLGLVFGLASRQTEGFLRSRLTLLNLDNDVPDHSTISRRKARLGKVASYERRTVKPVHLLIDSSGLSVHVGQLRTPPKARDYRKLHLAVDEQTSDVVACELTSKRARDASRVASLVGQIERPIASAKADAAYDTGDVYKTLENHRAHRSPKVLIPPRKGAQLALDSAGTRQRNRNIRARSRVGKRKWYVASGYSRRSKVETTFHRYKANPGLSDASEGTGVPESRGEVGVQDPEHHDGARDTRWRDDRMTGRRSHGRLSALNGVVHQGTNNATNLGQGSTTFRISGDMSPDVNAPVMGPFESSHQHGPPLLGRVRGPTRSPTSSLVCSPPTPSLPSAAAPVVPGRWPTLSLVRQGGRRASQVPGPSSSSVP